MALQVEKTSSGREYKVKDMSQADFGRLELELAEVEIPGLMSCRTKFDPSQPFKGAKITGSRQNNHRLDRIRRGGESPFHQQTEMPRRIIRRHSSAAIIQLRNLPRREAHERLLPNNRVRPLPLHPMHIQSQGNVTALNCPAPGCAGLLEPHQCRTTLPKEVFERWYDALCKAAVILGAERFYCPYKDSSTPEIRPHSTMATSSLAASKLLNIRTSPIKAASAALLSPSVQYTR